MQQRLGIGRIQAFIELRCLWKQRSGVAVAAHAQHQRIGLPIMLQRKSHGFFAVGQRSLIGTIGHHRNPMSGGGFVFQQIFAHQAGVAVGMIGGHDALVHQRDADIFPIQIFLRKRIKKSNRRAPARHGQHGLPFFIQRILQRFCHGIGQRGG